MSRPDADLARVADAHRRLLAVVATLDEADLGRPSLLPDWTVAHVLAHLARNADSHVRRAEAAAAGEVVEQYPGGFEGRAAEIEASTRRPAAEVLADVGATAARVEATWAATPDGAWDGMTTDVGGRQRPLRDLVGRRWQEAEVHLTDLGVGPTHRDWPDDFVAVWLPRLRLARPGDGHDLDERDELAWRYGRLTRPDLPVLEPWA